MNPDAATAEALRMIDAFASVGAERFDITHTDINEHVARAFLEGQGIEQVRRDLPGLVSDAAIRRRIRIAGGEFKDHWIEAGTNLILRPRGVRQFIQLDDLEQGRGLERVTPVAFLVLQTSPRPKGFQAWVAVEDDGGKAFASRLRRGTGADPTASGATRCAGTRNWKPGYKDDFPTVEILEATPGRIVTQAQLIALGLVAEPPAKPEPGSIVVPAAPYRARGQWRGGRKWPDYAAYLNGAPPNSTDTGPDRSKADFLWSKKALERRFTFDQVTAQLMKESTKAKERGEDYARQTVEHAAETLTSEIIPRR